jgi:hypothetical protein
VIVKQPGSTHFFFANTDTPRALAGEEEEKPETPEEKEARRARLQAQGRVIDAVAMGLMGGAVGAIVGKKLRWALAGAAAGALTPIAIASARGAILSGS